MACVHVVVTHVYHEYTHGVYVSHIHTNRTHAFHGYVNAMSPTIVPTPIPSHSYGKLRNLTQHAQVVFRMLEC